MFVGVNVSSNENNTIRVQWLYGCSFQSPATSASCSRSVWSYQYRHRLRNRTCVVADDDITSFWNERELGAGSVGRVSVCVSRSGMCGCRSAVGSRGWSAWRCCKPRGRALYWSTRCPTTSGRTASSDRCSPRTPVGRRCHPEHTR